MYVKIGFPDVVVTDLLKTDVLGLGFQHLLCLADRFNQHRLHDANVLFCWKFGKTDSSAVGFHFPEKVFRMAELSLSSLLDFTNDFLMIGLSASFELYAMNNFR